MGVYNLAVELTHGGSLDAPAPRRSPKHPPHRAACSIGTVPTSRPATNVLLRKTRCIEVHHDISHWQPSADKNNGVLWAESLDRTRAQSEM